MAIHPAGIKNSFMSQVVFWLFFLPVLTLIFMPLMHFEGDIEVQELTMISNAGVSLEEVNAATKDKFAAWFVDTGIYPASLAFFSNTTDIGYNMTTMATQAQSFGYDWVTSFWGIIYKGMWRLHALFWVYVAAIGAICLPCLLDGLMVRARKRYQFQSHNPLVFNMSTHTAVMVLGLLLYIPLIPFSLTPVIVAVFIGFLGLALWWAAANFQTGV